MWISPGILLLAVAGMTGAAAQAPPATKLKSDEAIVLYPTLGTRGPGGWEIEVQGRVFEPESRRWTLAAIEQALNLEAAALGPQAHARFEARLRGFLSDSERGKRVWVASGEARVESGRSGANGHFTATLRIDGTATAAGPSNAPGRVGLRVLLPAGDARRFAGEAFLLESTGLSVVSDLDDTIKISEVRDRSRLIRRTFVEPFEPVPGMAGVYRRWAAESGAAFHYVSGSPWQLYEPLADFMRQEGFPAGSFHLRTIRFSDRSALECVESPRRHKLEQIGALLRRYPQRRFLLVGDSGEEDPEIYGELARQHPRQIRAILIRNVTGEGRSAARYRAAFRELPATPWVVFEAAAEMGSALQPAAP